MRDASSVVEALVDNHRRFLAFLERRLGSPSAAEDILQAAYARAVEKGVPAGDEEGSVSWFFTVLRNALTDHYRRRATETRSLDALQAAGVPVIADPELRAEVCGCFRGLMRAMRREYAEILEMVDLEERSVAEVSRELGITTNNAIPPNHAHQYHTKRPHAYRLHARALTHPSSGQGE